MKILLEDVAEIVCLQLGVDRAEPDQYLQADLDADSADLLNLVVAAEDRFGITIPEEEIAELRTVDDFHRMVCRLATP